ncbi:MAG: isoprenylcysteine carboxylmethyltransferase family protein [Planctomycetes bacterium]|nr:isoprenylcysteine carboxylmethyltransferase family protein [Planctomycetota bacterium]
MRRRAAVLAYGIVSYLIFLASFLYAIGFLANQVVPKSIDSGPTGSPAASILVNMLLLALFAVQHSVMARPAFKRWWTRVIAAPMERSTYVLVASLLLLLLYWQWRPLPQPVWAVTNPAIIAAVHGISAAGWLVVLGATFMIDHFDLFGLRQTYGHFAGWKDAPTPFMTPYLYRWIRHPIMLGFIIAFWATPAMSIGRFLFAAVTTAYILVAIQLEERDLIHAHGDDYRAYRSRTSMLVPIPRRTPPP